MVIKNNKHNLVIFMGQSNKCGLDCLHLKFKPDNQKLADS
jgi:hypothetical protein